MVFVWLTWLQWTFLLVCVASIWVQNHLLSAYMLMGGVALSRPGLRTFDLSVIQQMQVSRPLLCQKKNNISYHDLIFWINKRSIFHIFVWCFLLGSLDVDMLFPHYYFSPWKDHVPESDRCVVGGVQNSLQSSMDLMGYVMGVVISNPQVQIILICVFFLVFFKD